MRIPIKVSKKFVGMIIRSRKTILNDGVMTVSSLVFIFSWPKNRSMAFDFSIVYMKSTPLRLMLFIQLFDNTRAKHKDCFFSSDLLRLI